MGTKLLLKKAIEIVTFVFAAFGHFLLKIAPPEEGDIQFTVGISSFLALCVFLYISAISKNLPRRKYRKRWLLAAVIFVIIAFIAALAYYSNFLKYTFRYPAETSSEVYFSGTEFTDVAKKYIDNDPDKSVQEVVADFGGLVGRTRVWNIESIRKAKIVLTINYIVVVLSLAITIFCLTEVIIQQSKTNP